jgi:hypothetical protein
VGDAWGPHVPNFRMQAAARDALDPPLRVAWCVKSSCDDEMVFGPERRPLGAAGVGVREGMQHDMQEAVALHITRLRAAQQGGPVGDFSRRGAQDGAADARSEMARRGVSCHVARLGLAEGIVEGTLHADSASRYRFYSHCTCQTMDE